MIKVHSSYLNLFLFSLQEWHINLFGEIVHDEPEQDQIIESTEEDLVILNERSTQTGKVFKKTQESRTIPIIFRVLRILE